MVSDVPPRFLTLRRRLGVAAVVWFAMLGLDLVVNAALFAWMYQHAGPFMLAPTEAFRRIPLGYLGFLVLAVGIVELTYRLRVIRLVDGLSIGLLIGAVLAATWSLGLYSVATLSAEVALAFAGIWWILVVVGTGVAAAGIGRTSLRGLALGVGAFDVLCVATVIVLQSFGVVSTVKL
jgi:hypothetical protein